MYYEPYAWVSQHSLSENICINLCIFIIIKTYSINIKIKKGALKKRRAFFFIFAWKYQVLVYALKIANTRELPNAAYALLLPA